MRDRPKPGESLVRFNLGSPRRRWLPLQRHEPEQLGWQGWPQSEPLSPTWTGMVGVKLDSCWALNSSKGLRSPSLLTTRVQEGL